MKANLFGLVICAALIGGSQARATEIEYNVNFVWGPNSVVGTIKTNGKLGKLSKSDIISWNFTEINNIHGANVLSGPSAQSTIEIEPGEHALTASPSSLIFNFADPTGGYLVFANEKTGIEWSLNAAGSPSDYGYSMIIGPGYSGIVGSSPPDPRPLNASFYGGAYGGAAFGYAPHTIGVACPDNATWDARSATCGCSVKGDGIINGRCVSLSATCSPGDGYIIRQDGLQCVRLPICPADCKLGCLIDNMPATPIKFICRQADGPRP